MRNTDEILADIEKLTRGLELGAKLHIAARELSVTGSARQTRYGFCLGHEDLLRGLSFPKVLTSHFPGGYGWSEPGFVELVTAGVVGDDLVGSLRRGRQYLLLHSKIEDAVNVELKLLGRLLEGGVPPLHALQVLSVTSGVSQETAHACAIFITEIRQGCKIGDTYGDLLTALWGSDAARAFIEGERDGNLDARLITLD